MQLIDTHVGERPEGLRWGVETIRAHPKYKKVVRRSRRLHAHDEQNSATIGDVVRIVETRPISKTKNWRLAEIVEKAR